MLQTANKIIKLYEGHTAIRRPPKNLREADLPLFAHEFSKEIPETSIQTLSNVDILDDSIFSLSDLKFYSKHTNVNGLSNQILNKYKLYFKRYEVLESGIWVIDNWSINYFHWVTDAIPRLIAAAEFTGKHHVILPQVYQTLMFVIQSLELLGFKPLFYKNYQRLRVRELLLPSHTHPSGNFNKEIINIVKQKFVRNSYLIASRRIYISRQRATKRKIGNEPEVIGILKKYQFEIHFFEDYDFEKQIEIMHGASHIVGLHGAGMTNMLFMNQGSKVLELRNAEDAHNNCYFSLASDLQHDYYYLLNKGDTDDFHSGNVTVDAEELKIVLEKMID